MPESIQLLPGDALLIVDVQNDFLKDGKLAVPYGDQVIPVLNQYIALFSACSLPVFATRDWHPADHCSFKQRGGPWPPHCIANTPGAEFPPMLDLPQNGSVISKATMPDKDAYSGFEGTDLAVRLQVLHVDRLFIGGLATDYCVLNTVLDALSVGFKAILLGDAIRAVDIQAEDGPAAIEKMRKHGAQLAQLSDIDAFIPSRSGMPYAQRP